MTDDSESLEENIVKQFLSNLESSDDISEEVSDTLSNLSDKDDFGGRDQIVDVVLEAVSEDED
jgi:3-hydroxyacyl-CoA dehydrogenase